MSDKKKKIAVITIDAKLGNETMGATRYRTLAELLFENGYEVDFITSSFQHWEKKPRDVEKFKTGTDAYSVVFIDEPGYEKNIDLRRVISHREAVKNLKRLLETDFDYDLVYCQIPPNNLALVAAEVARKHGVPFVVDVNDLWPEAMYMAFDVPVVSKLLFSGFARDAKSVYSLASAVVGTSEEYASRAFQDRDEDIPKLVVYVGNDLAEFDQGVAKHSGDIKKPEGEFWITYAGNLGISYDLKTLISASAQLKAAGYKDICIKILGGGPAEGELKSFADSLDCSVDFLGYKPYEEMAAYLVKSDIVVNSLIKKASQSIVTKIGDYLASGHPMINTSGSAEFKAKVLADGFGVNVEAEDIGALAEAIARLYENPQTCAEMGRKARAVAEEQFDRPKSYLKTVELIDGLLGC